MTHHQPPAATPLRATTGAFADDQAGGRIESEGKGPKTYIKRTIPDARLRQLAQRLHALGERPLYELLRELAAGADLIARLERYAELDPATVRALGGDRFPGPYAIDGGRR